MQEEVERLEVRQLKALHRPRDDALEVLAHARGGDFPHQYRIVLRLPGDEPNVRGVALVPGTGVGDRHQRREGGPGLLPPSRPGPRHAATPRLSGAAGRWAPTPPGWGRPP